MLDTWQELLSAGGVIVCILLLVTRPIMAYLKGGGRVKAGKVEVGGGMECSAYIKDHSETLARLDFKMNEMLESIRQLSLTIESQLGLIQEIDKTQGPQIASQAITLQWIRQQLGRGEGKEINGNLDKAIRLIEEADTRYQNRRAIGGGI